MFDTLGYGFLNISIESKLILDVKEEIARKDLFSLVVKLQEHH